MLTLCPARIGFDSCENRRWPIRRVIFTKWNQENTAANTPLPRSINDGVDHFFSQRIFGKVLRRIEDLPMLTSHDALTSPAVTGVAESPIVLG